MGLAFDNDPQAAFDQMQMMLEARPWRLRIVNVRAGRELAFENLAGEALRGGRDGAAPEARSTHLSTPIAIASDEWRQISPRPYASRREIVRP